MTYIVEYLGIGCWRWQRWAHVMYRPMAEQIAQRCTADLGFVMRVREVREES